MRERFDSEGRRLTRAHLGLQLIHLTGPVRVLDLRRDDTLDALGLDDQVSTARAYEIWQASRRLTDLVTQWFGNRCHGIAYRPRTTPERSANLAFFEHAPLQAHSLGTLREQPDLLERCVVGEGFEIQGWR